MLDVGETCQFHKKLWSEQRITPCIFYKKEAMKSRKKPEKIKIGGLPKDEYLFLCKILVAIGRKLW